MELWREIPHGALPGTIADVWTEEQAALMPQPQAFDGFVEKSKRVSPTCLISFDRNPQRHTITIQIVAQFSSRLSRYTKPSRLICAPVPN